MASDDVLDKVGPLRATWEEIEMRMADPATHEDPDLYQKLARQHAEIKPLIAAADAVVEARESAETAREFEADADGDEAATWAKEAQTHEARAAKAEEKLRDLLVPADPDDSRDVIVEVRSAAGGDEAGLFAAELANMYESYAASKGWKVTSVDRSENNVGGIREATFEITGAGAFAHLKHESGVHRVQRVPSTESSGRIHTSTASVAVLPVAEEVEVNIQPSDVRMDVFRSSGPGGQSVNTTDSAVRLTHIPTGLVVSCQDQKSQHQNRDKAMRVLASRLLQMQREEAMASRADARLTQIGSGDRSEKIRTYNFPQTRITDHRIGVTVHNVAAVMNGELDELIEALRNEERSKLLEASAEQAMPGQG